MTNEYGGTVFLRTSGNSNIFIPIYRRWLIIWPKNLIAGIMVHVKKVFSEDYSMFMGSRL
jgi:hypothetical protein